MSLSPLLSESSGPKSECALRFAVLTLSTCVHQEQVCGLCGNFDGIQNNDFTGSNLHVEEDPVDFGNSWKVSPQCADTRKVRPGSPRGPWVAGRGCCALQWWQGPEEGPLDPSGLTVWGSLCSLALSPGAAGLVPCQLPQQHREAGHGGFLLQDPHQWHLPGLQQAGEGCGVARGRRDKRGGGV